MMDRKGSKAEFSWPLGKLPFFWGPLPSPSNGEGLPDELEFELTFDGATGLIRQRPNEKVSEALRIAYAKGSHISGMMEDKGIGLRYAEDFLNFIETFGGWEDFPHLRILEIGCGTGFLLSRLKGKGAAVLGIEPGAHGREGAAKYGVPIIQGYFPNEKMRGKFDCIIFYGVLEHIEDPIPFLLAVSDFLTRDGKMFLSVPNCGEGIGEGDLSILIHEHWSYFSRGTLEATLESCGAGEIAIEASGFGGALYAVAGQFGDSRTGTSSEARPGLDSAEAFKRAAALKQSVFRKYFSKLRRENKTVGIYVPMRVMNLLAMTPPPWPTLQFFDDNPLFFGKYFPGLPVPVENRIQLLADPPDTVLIMSKTFGEAIRAELIEQLHGETEILSVAELF